MRREGVREGGVCEPQAVRKWVNGIEIVCRLI